MQVPTIILLGVKHSGKTSAGRLAARKLGLDFRDVDELVAARLPAEFANIRQFVAALGIDEFRRLEAECLRHLAAAPAPCPGRILAAGGGLAENPDGLAALPAAWLKIFLDADPETLYRRITAGGLPHFLAGADPHGAFIRVYTVRSATYRGLANAVIDTRGLDVPGTATAITAAIKEHCHGR